MVNHDVVSQGSLSHYMFPFTANYPLHEMGSITYPIFKTVKTSKVIEQVLTNACCSMELLLYTESCDAHHEKTDLKVFAVVIPKEGWARVATPILL